MPNWCDNTLHMTHEDPEMIKRAKFAFNRGEFLNEFLPCPTGEEENWYSWNCENWGTKWDVGEEGMLSKEDLEEESDSVFLSFESAWSPPVAAYSKLEELGFEVEAYYYEPGCCFCGKYVDGEETYIEIVGNSEWARENIPADIEEVFGIVDNMAWWEEQSEDEEQEEQE